MQHDSTSNSQNEHSNKDEPKYGGMIKQSYRKILRNQFFSLFSYLDSIVPNFFPIHSIISIWRIVQLVGPCICAANSSVWKSKSNESMAVSVLSVFFHLIPVDYRKDASVPVQFVYSAINIIFFILILGSSFYYNKYSKLPNYLPSILSVYIHTLGYLIHPIALNIVGENIGRLIDGQSLKNDKNVEIAAIIISIICFLFWLLFFDQIAINSILFRPNSLASALSTPQIIVFITTCAVTFLTGIASQLSKYPSSILTIIAGICYTGSILSVFMPGTFIDSRHKRIIFATSITSCILTIVMGIYIICEQKGSFAEILIYLVAIIIVYIISIFIFKYILRKQLNCLDDFQSKQLTIYDITKADHIVTLGITGMKYAHPSCLNWELFREGTERWPLNVKIWVIFCKFVAVYPSEITLLSHLIFRMTANKLKGNLAKQIISQAISIYTQRESSLTTVLKTKLNRSLKNVQVTKGKLRHVWDLAIQGSVNEMEISINTAYQSVNKCRSYFNHLLSQYPNNRFVARSYLRFVREIECDPKKSAEWSEKVQLFQRGVSVNADRANILGFHAFPDLPPLISDANAHNIVSESESFISETDNATEDVNANQSELTEQITVIRDYIDNLKIPATLCIRTWNLFLFFICILLPAIIILAILPKYLDSLSQSLHYMYHLSFIRALSVQTPIFANHFLNEEIGFYPAPLINMVPEAYGYEIETDLMLRFLIREMSSQLEEVNKYRSFQAKNKYVSEAHRVIFSGVIPYKYYISQKQNMGAASTLQGALSDVIMCSSKILDAINELDCKNDNESCWNLHNQTMFLNPYMNYGTITENISKALTLMTEYLHVNASNTQNLAIFICLFICIVYVLVILGILVYEMNYLENCKKSIYKCLTSLPKNVVSNISESFRITRNSGDPEDENVVEDDTELNKQEENILKIFTSSSDASSMKSHDKTVLIATSAFLSICAIVITAVLAFTFPQIAKQLNNNAPHLDYVLGTLGFGFAAIGAVDNIILTSSCHGITGSITYNCEDPESDPMSVYLRSYQVNYAREQLSIFIKYYHHARFGGEDTDLPPYSLFEDGIDEANSVTEGCEGYDYDEGPPKFFNCYNSDIQINMFKPLITMIVTPIGDGYNNQFNTSSPELQQLWNLITMGLCSKILYPMFDKIVPEMESTLDKIIPPIDAAVAVVLILGFIDILIILLQIYSSEAKMKFALSFLLQCPPSVVLQNQKIMDILMGNFASKTKDVSSHNNRFFDSIVESIPDSVIVCSSDFKVAKINKATERIYGISEQDLIEKDAKEFFTDDKLFNSSTNELFEGINSNSRTEYQKVGDDTKSFLDIKMSFIGNNYVFITRDVTQTVLYNTLIAEERAKSDHLLSSILPPNLVKRVQDGEKNISFGVQSASILFLDIVEFTPWCASNTASMVMATLNALFRIYDAYLANHSTLTKIKCIGDCYMAAGGIFVEINQAAVHAKEMVEFGLETIAAIEENNKEMDLSLRIRVGVNTGGPIVAGVLGTEKPTFEILGPAINMAQQMEHHGVPMKVHISRSTYELIYGGSFVIKERGQIEIKKGKVLTYLVESKK